MEEYEGAKIIAQEISSLLAHPGWNYVKSFLERTRQAAITGLVSAKNMEEVLRYQAVIQAVDGIQEELRSLQQQGQIAQKLLRGEISA